MWYSFVLNLFLSTTINNFKKNKLQRIFSNHLKNVGSYKYIAPIFTIVLLAYDFADVAIVKWIFRFGCGSRGCLVGY